MKSESEIAQSCLTLCDHIDCMTRLLHPWDFPGKKTGVGCPFLLQGIFPTQGLNLGLPLCRQMLYHLSYQESQNIVHKHREKTLDRILPNETSIMTIIQENNYQHMLNEEAAGLDNKQPLHQKY